MTEPSHESAASAAQQALRTVVDKGADEAALSTLAGTEVLVPALLNGEGPGPKALSLPVYEQEDGTELVPVFTTLARMERALPQIRRHRSVVLGALAHEWPSESLALVIDAGTPEQLALTAQGVKTLLDRDED
ncbi:MULTISPECIES: SseB family protein [unclassified Streptomyces]|uniref:SseB family protein n=1 Tax=unclassified Streptomyces TaxID=2593676 RepID=UPI0022517114|nr:MULTISPECIES: SseB family protein [unclassified Streptomyces]MCX5329645.1 SseB family protein [Streptomyces sp. NBC_00140]MCX5359061.1 SseB family protein [Streptomyces sp. NBC_00124]